MGNLIIPEQYGGGIQKIHHLSESQMMELLQTLTSERPMIGRKKLIACLKSKLTNLDENTVEEIATTLLALHSFRSFLDKSVDDFVQDIADSENLSSLEIPEAEHEPLKKRLLQLLSVQMLAIASKALNVLTAHEHVLDNTRILTDIRPIYRDDSANIVEDEPAAAVIIHMLGLRYQDGGEVKEFFVALDTEDVRKMQAVLERANAKADTLKTMLKKAGVPYLEIETESR